MKKIQLYVTATMMLLLSSIAYSQPPDRPFEGREGGPPSERIEGYRKMRLIEVLKLSEEESVRFFAKQSAHEEKMKDIMDERNDVLNDMEDVLDKKAQKDLPKLIDKVKELDQKVFQERQRYQDDVAKLLSTDKFAKFIIFERNFGKQMRDAMGDFIKNRRERRRGGNEE